MVTMGGTSYPLMVNSQDTVSSLKVMIQAKTRDPPENQHLTLVTGGGRRPLDEDRRPLCSYGVRAGARISLLLREPHTIQVFLKNPNGNLNTYDVARNEVVRRFKEAVQTREGVQASQQRLLFQSREMMDASRLSDYGVKEHSTIDLMMRLRGG